MLRTIRRARRAVIIALAAAGVAVASGAALGWDWNAAPAGGASHGTVVAGSASPYGKAWN
jgi:hypothetical protein